MRRHSLFIVVAASTFALLPTTSQAAGCKARGTTQVTFRDNINCGRAYGVANAFSNAPTDTDTTVLFETGTHVWTLGAWRCRIHVTSRQDPSSEHPVGYAKFACHNIGFESRFKYKAGPYA